MKGEEGSDGKQKEEEEDSIGRGISERWFNESMRQYRIRERENNENNMGGSENEETFFYFYFFSVVYFFLTKLKYSTLYPFTRFPLKESHVLLNISFIYMVDLGSIFYQKK